LHERYGKLPFADLMEPAIEIAERGYAVPPVVAQKWAAAVPELKDQPGFAHTFMPNGRAPHVGERFVFKDVANTLRRIGATKGRDLYEGETAEKIIAFIQANGGVHTLDDLRSYQPDWVTPISKNYRGYTLHEIPPNGQGIAALMALGILEHFDLASMKVDSVESQHIQIEAMKLAMADLYRYVSDGRTMEVTPAQMLDNTYLAERAKLIDPSKATHFGPGQPATGGTIYLTAADESGMMISFIQSNYMGFGSGCVEPQFGISLQNRGHAFGLQPGPNQVAPGKRPFHTIIPAFLSRAGQPVMSFGVMGANMQPQGHVQTLVRMLDHRQSPQAACDAPRWRFNAGLEINVEAGMQAATAQGLQALGHRVEVLNDSYQDFGAGQFIWRAGEPAVQGYVAASDARRDGQAVGF
jgi:gamma-glutamyltranspeptidase/glutathione hydrolase